MSDVTGSGPSVERSDEILNADALEFVALLHRRFARDPRRPTGPRATLRPQDFDFCPRPPPSATALASRPRRRPI